MMRSAKLPSSGESKIRPAGLVLAQGQHLGRGISDRAGVATLSVYAPSQELPAHRHEGAYLVLMLGGGFIQEARGRETRLRIGDVGYYPQGDHHRNKFDPRGGLCLTLWLPSAIAPCAFRVHAVPLRLRLQADRIANDLVLGEADRLDIECLVAEFNVGNRPNDSDTDGPIHKVIEALECRQACSLEELAAIAGRHPMHLARTFRKKTGLTIGAYRRRLRLRDLCVDLKTDSASLSELAARHGYSDQAHMTREFKAMCGTTPGAWRGC